MSYFIDKLAESENLEGIFRTLDEMEVLNIDRQFIMKDIGLTSRVFNHWIQTGLVTSTSKAGDYRYEFSFVELIWFNIVKELRDYGFPIEKIKIVYQELMEPVLFLKELNKLSVEKKRALIIDIIELWKDDEEKGKEFAAFLERELLEPRDTTKGHYDLLIVPLHALIGTFLFERKDVRILINNDGKVFTITQNSYLEGNVHTQMTDHGFDSQSYLDISLLKFLGKFILKKGNQNFAKDHHFLNENEAYILDLIREGKAKEITIKFMDEKPVFLVITKEQKIFAESRVSDAILSKKYQDIIIKTQDGKIAYSNIIIKEKLKQNGTE